MGKSSSSRRKKRSKASSQARTGKRSKTRNKKHESKKLRHRVSNSDESSSSMSGSSSSSSSQELKLKSKTSRLRTRKDVISSKKRAKRRSYSVESSEDSPRVRKRKGSKRKRDYEAKRKTYSKKKPRRGDSVRSLSSRSLSCSTCQGDSLSSHEVEFKSHRSKRAREERDLEKVESTKKRSRYGSRSSSYSQCSESSNYQSKEKVLVENKSRWLRSVITVAERDDEERGLDKDEHKEEIIFVHDDYPSCRSNDSLDVGSKRVEGEGDYISHVDPEKKMRLENEKGNDTAVSDFRLTKLSNSGKVSDEDDDGHFDGNNRSSEEFGTTDPVNEKTSEVFGANSSVNETDLESVLRQKALENLRRFRGGHQFSGNTTLNQKDKIDVDEKAKQSCTAKAESVQTRFTEQDDTKVVGVNSPKEDPVEAVVSTEPQSVKGVRVPAVTKGPTCSSQIKENIIERNIGCSDSVSAKQIVACSTDQMTIAGESKQKVNAANSAVKAKLAKPALTHQLSNTHSALKQAPKGEESQIDEIITDRNPGGNESVSAKQNIARSTDWMTIAGNSKQKVNAGTSALKPKLATLASKTHSPLKQASKAEESRAKLLETKNTLDETAVLTSPAVTKNSDIDGKDINNACSSAAFEPSKSTSGDAKSDKLQDEAEEGSQFEQKTMSVMRGGEMVEVSYKVYIPKKAPALARRQLKR
ncbi:hypothetical protein PanWU01x14_346840 [Parasponia andersonii]|uniref:Uncharacterized protein n=1 Tax=Parasponia andersonii TaxID=3476 RepID=A0A2P5ACA0_PARAD|nr:hypothetical protein PanWU01x14_346840 [Parasponia andersonii]